jgi:hypothetical protein
VGTVEGDLAHALESREDPGALRAEHVTDLVQADRQLAPGVAGRAIHQRVVGTVGGPEDEFVACRCRERCHRL